ncbi:hypothetical protein [Streptococcus suis]|uniref:Uncharacterized protein n=1 Tax=Streptococcus suis TaxID=1307 RepID=A0A0Z8LEF8_STRSU|nr:hypothetical protein [Streptococcus suis]NQG86426.1 hypothetical protein [Streptococcus suis]CYV88995.1 Uncharacterised protein [Streptococcus suis]HEL2651938.1 hypothetical protein [Streptococcus suis]
MRISKRQLILLVMVAVFILVSGLGYYFYKDSKMNKDYDYTSWDSYIEDYQFLKGHSSALITWETTPKEEVDKRLAYSPYVNQVERPDSLNGYIIYLSFRLKEVPESSFVKQGFLGEVAFDRHQLEDGEYLKLIVYTSEDGHIRQKEIDVHQAIQNFDKDYIYDGRGRKISQLGDRTVLGLVIRKVGAGRESKREVYLDVKTGEVFEDETKAVEYPNNIFELGTVLETNLSSQGIDFNSVSQYIKLTTTEDGEIVIPETSTIDRSVLAQTESEIYQALLEKESIYLLGDSESIATILDNLELFYPQPEDLYQGVTIPVEYSVDGQVHEVNSRDEFLRYFKQTEEVSE